MPTPPTLPSRDTSAFSRTATQGPKSTTSATSFPSGRRRNMSTEARNAHLRAIWRYQDHLNSTRARLLAGITDEEHFRFVTMYPLPIQDDDELQELRPPTEEVLEAMRSEGVRGDGWDAGDDWSGYHADPMEVDPWDSGSDEGGYSSDEDEYSSDGEDARDVASSREDGARRQDEDGDKDVDMDKPDNDSGIEIYESDDWPDSTGVAGDAKSTFADNAQDADQETFFDSPSSPISFSSSDSSEDERTCPRSTTSTPFEQEDIPAEQENTPTGQEKKTDTRPPPQPLSTLPKFTLDALDRPTTTAETLMSFEMAYSDVYNAGANVWRFGRVQEGKRWEGFQRRFESRQRGPSKLRNEVLVEDLEDEWGYGEPGRSW